MIMSKAANIYWMLTLPDSSMVKNPPENAGATGDTGSIPALEWSPRVDNGNPLQYSCLENSMDKRAWWAKVHGVSKSQTGLSSTSLWSFMGAFQVALVVKNPPTMQLVVKNLPTMQEFNPWVEKIPWSRKWQPAPVFLPGKSHGQRTLPGYSPLDQKESDMTDCHCH